MTRSDHSYNLLIDLDMKHCQLAAEQIAKMEASLSPLREAVEAFPVSKLHVLVSYRSRTADYVVRTSLILTGQTLVSSDHDPLVHAAFEHCIDNLIRELQRYKDRLGNVAERAKQEEGTHHELIPTISPDADAIEAAVQDGDYAAFRVATSGYDEPVRALVGRWVERYPQVAARLGHGMEIGHIVEDVFLTAFEDYPHRPQQIRFGDWLGRYIDEAIRAIAAHPDREMENVNMARLAREAQTGPGSV
jgi:ribosome-associated translation inhibitor RaiA